MCGRYVLRDPAGALVRVFRSLGAEPPVVDDERAVARYNVAPTQDVPIVRRDKAGSVEVAFVRWGLIPHWAKDERQAARLINARIETAAEKPSFREGIRRFRCLVPADGFIEWQREGKHKRPHLFSLADDEPFAFAGIWSRWKGGPGVVDSCSILTTEASGEVAVIHDRMPVVVPPELAQWWLSDDDVSGALDVLRQAAPAFVDTPVSSRINSPRNDDPECLAGPD